MANTRSAEKQERQAAKRNTRNRAAKSRLRTTLKNTRSTISGGDADKDALSTAFSEVDKAAKKGIIKTNTADRYKSRLAAASKRSASK
jgi:small subunit ribosomal protein S20